MTQIVSASVDMPPSPGGEGWGEGERFSSLVFFALRPAVSGLLRISTL
jgi:hypothetical protein